jgi:hypothetical protein
MQEGERNLFEKSVPFPLLHLPLSSENFQKNFIGFNSEMNYDKILI